MSWMPSPPRIRAPCHRLVRRATATAIYTMADVARLSDQAAAWFQAQGIRKGDTVMLILKRRALLVCRARLHKIGASPSRPPTC